MKDDEGYEKHEGLEPEEWEERCKNYRELIKALSSFVHQTIKSARDMQVVPYPSVESMKEDLFKFPIPDLLKDNLKIKEIHDYNFDNPHDSESAKKALIEISKMFSEGNEDGK